MHVCIGVFIYTRYTSWVVLFLVFTVGMDGQGNPKLYELLYGFERFHRFICLLIGQSVGVFVLPADEYLISVFCSTSIDVEMETNFVSRRSSVFYSTSFPVLLLSRKSLQGFQINLGIYEDEACPRSMLARPPGAIGNRWEPLKPTSLNRNWEYGGAQTPDCP